MKAIHNGCDGTSSWFATVFNTSKLQNESNSQLPANSGIGKLYCVQYVKITK